MFNLPAFLLGADMGVVVYVEFRGAAILKRFDAAAPRKLGWNQIGFGALLIAYAVW